MLNDTEENMICNNNTDKSLSMNMICSNKSETVQNNINNNTNLSMDTSSLNVKNELDQTEPDIITNTAGTKYSVVTSDISDYESDISSTSSISHTSMSTRECNKVPLLVRVTKEVRDCMLNRECIVLLPKLTTRTIEYWKPKEPYYEIGE